MVCVYFVAGFCLKNVGKFKMHLSMFSPREGGRGGADVGHLIKRVLLRVGNLTGKFVPWSGDLNVQSIRLGPSLFCSSCRISGEWFFTTFSH